jgi:hypothetical protein
MSPPVQTLGSRVQVPFEARMPEFILCLYYPMYVEALRRADTPSKESYRLSKRLKKLKWIRVSEMPYTPEGEAVIIVLSRDRVTIDRVWIGNWIYWILTDRNYKWR